MSQKKKESRFFKPGKGIDKDARKKNVVFRFFELLIRKMTRLCVINVLYLVCILPLVCAAITLMLPALVDESFILGTESIKLIMNISLRIPLPISIILVIISAICFGPITCGFAYCMRNLATERHVWYSELFTKAKENFKQGLVFGLIDIVILTSFVLYLGLDISGQSGMTYYFYLALKILATIISAFYFIMRFYIYTLIVTFDLPIKGIFKNSYIFAVLGFGRNILVTVIVAFAAFSLASTPLLDIFLYGTFLISFCGFLTSYATYPVIEKYMLNAKEKTGDEKK